MTQSSAPAVGGAEDGHPADEASVVPGNPGTPGLGAAPSYTANAEAPGRPAADAAGTEHGMSAALPDIGRTPRLGHADGRSSGQKQVRSYKRGSGGRTASRIRFLNLDLTNPHQMTASEIARLLLLYLVLHLALIACACVMTIIVFDHLVAALAANAHELRQLNPSEVQTTIYCVWGFTSIALAARTIHKLWPRAELVEDNDLGPGLSLDEELDFDMPEE